MADGKKIGESRGKGLKMRDSLQEYVERGLITQAEQNVLREAILSRKNILIAGKDGAGKNAFVNVLLKEMESLTPEHRVVILEDNADPQCLTRLRNQENIMTLQCSMKNFFALTTGNHPNATMQDLIKVAIRYQPDRVVLDKINGIEEALYLLQAWERYPGGICTLYAKSARDGVARMEEFFFGLAGLAPKKRIAKVIDIVVFLMKGTNGPELTELIALEGIKDEQYVFRDL